MGLFNKRADPISDHARRLNAEIAALEAKIKKLEQAGVAPRSNPGAGPAPRNSPPPARPFREPVFEEVDRNRLSHPETVSTPEHYNELGVRKYDLTSLWRRCQGLFRSAPPNNPRLINYLAVGSIQGLRPLRYEKRVARNRVIGLCLVLLAVLLSIVGLIMRHR
jgi:hypothetical protein